MALFKYLDRVRLINKPEITGTIVGLKQTESKESGVIYKAKYILLLDNEIDSIHNDFGKCKAVEVSNIYLEAI